MFHEELVVPSELLDRQTAFMPSQDGFINVKDRVQLSAAATRTIASSRTESSRPCAFELIV